MWTKQHMIEQVYDKTPYTNTQLDFILRVANFNINYQWPIFEEENVKLINCAQNVFGPTFTLFINNLCYMTTTSPDILDHRKILEEMDGDILLTGLGLGIGILLANYNTKIKSITVLENNPIIIKNIGESLIDWCPHIKPNIIMADANTWETDKTFDYAYVDHAYEKADDSNITKFSNNIIQWWDERQELEETWR